MNLQNTEAFFESMDSMRQEIGFLLQSQQIYAAILATLIEDNENKELIVPTEKAKIYSGAIPVVSQVGTALRVYLPEADDQEPANGNS